MQVAIAPEHEQIILPRYEVHKIDGNVNVRIAALKYRENNAGKKVSNGFEFETVERPGGFMVYFPAGHSIRVGTEEELKRLGFMDEGDLVDMNTGDIIPRQHEVSLKDRTAHRTHNRRRIEHVAAASE